MELQLRIDGMTVELSALVTYFNYETASLRRQFVLGLHGLLCEGMLVAGIGRVTVKWISNVRSRRLYSDSGGIIWSRRSTAT
jgi:hypothetical protein